MTLEELKEKLNGVYPNLHCFAFLCERLARDDYRGTHKFQHYRWNKEYIKIVLNELAKYDLLYHTQGDIYADYVYKSEEIAFADFLKNVNIKLNEIGYSITNMAMRKIIFVNLQRMGFVDRFNNKKQFCDPSKKSQYRYVKLSSFGKYFLESSNAYEEQKYLGIALDNVFDGLAQEVLDIINGLDKSYIDEYEFMFFISFLGKFYKGKILLQDDILGFINEYRNLKSRTKIAENLIEQYCNPKNFTGDKTQKRDFHNWKNEAQSIFENLAMLGIFEYDKENKRLFVRGEFSGEKIKFKRSNLVKQEYFKQHKITKNEQFELHHIVPFYFAKDFSQLEAIDNWQNLIYIDANSHRTLTINKVAKMAIRLTFKDKNVVLDNFADYFLELLYDDKVKYNISLQNKLLQYNQSLI